MEQLTVCPEVITEVLSAAEQGDCKSMALYITRRQVDVEDEEGCTPLMAAAANGRNKIMSLLLEREVSTVYVLCADNRYMSQMYVSTISTNYINMSILC